MSFRVVVSLASLLFFAGFAATGIVAPDCKTYPWSLNSLGHNACTVAAFLFSTCHSGSFTIQALPSGAHYTGPSSSQKNDSCLCNTVAYSLLSACDGCQGSDWTTFSDYIANCTTVLPPGRFPHPVPNGTAVPHWALDATVTTNWNPVKASGLGDSPEAGPGTDLS